MTTAVVITVFMGYVAYFNDSNSLSHSLQSASIDGNTRFAPAWVSTSSFNGPVLAATVKRPAATPAVTPSGAFSTTITSSGAKPPRSKAKR